MDTSPRSGKKTPHKQIRLDNELEAGMAESAFYCLVHFNDTSSFKMHTNERMRKNLDSERYAYWLAEKAKWLKEQERKGVNLAPYMRDLS